MGTRSRVIVAAVVVGVLAAGLGVSGALPGSPNPVFDGMTPVRILDTRDGLGAPKAPIGAGQTINVTVAGQNGIPPEATSVVMNLTAVGATQVTHLTVWPTGESQPDASNLNPSNGNATPNLVTVAIGTGGQVSIFNNSGTVHVIADVVGYYRDHDHDDRYYTETEVEALLAERDSTVSSLAASVSSLQVDAATFTSTIADLEGRVDELESANGSGFMLDTETRPLAISPSVGAPMDWTSALSFAPDDSYFGAPVLSSPATASSIVVDLEATGFACQQPGGAQVGDNLQFRVVVDGVISDAVTFESGWPLDQTSTITLAVLPAPGSHTFDIQYRVMQGTPKCVFAGYVQLRLLT